MSLDLSAIDAVVKTKYSDPALEDLTYKKNPFLAMVPKDESFSTRDYKFALSYGNPQSVSADFATAQSAASSASSKFGGFTVTRATKHGVAIITGDAIASTRGDKDAFIRAVKSEVDGMINAMTNRLAGEIFSAGWGDVGQIGANSGATVTMSNINDIVKVEVGQLHVFSSSRNAATLRDSGQALTVSGVNRSTGVVTYSENVSEIASLQNTDYIFIKGDRENSATPSHLCVLGVEAWIPVTAPDSTAFCGQNRSLDVVRMAGNRQDSTGQPLMEALLDADAAVFREGGELSHMFLSPKNFAELVKSMSSQVRYQEQKVGRVGFNSVLVAGQAGDIAIVADRNVPSSRIYGLTLDDWELLSDKKAIRINTDLDGFTAIRSASADAAEVRGISRAQLVCRAPGHQIVVSI